MCICYLCNGHNVAHRGDSNLRYISDANFLGSHVGDSHSKGHERHVHNGKLRFTPFRFQFNRSGQYQSR